MRTRVKICGITRVEDALAAAAHGADAIGLISYPPSPRYVTPDRAREIVASTPAFVSTVAVFVNPAREEVERVIREERGDPAAVPRRRIAGVLRAVFSPVHQGCADSPWTGFDKIPFASRGR